LNKKKIRPNDLYFDTHTHTHTEEYPGVLFTITKVNEDWVFIKHELANDLN